MGRRQGVWRIGNLTCCGVLGLAMAAAVYAAPPNQPHVVVILADDLGYGDPACYNAASPMRTPGMDRLAREGVRFTDAHAAAAWCTPSRYGLLTGRYPWRSPRGLVGGVIEPERPTLASWLSQLGYQTACIGKWHLGFDTSAVERDFSLPFTGGPLSRGFQQFFGMHASLDIPPYYWIEGERCLEPPTLPVAASGSPEVTEIQGPFWRAGLRAPSFSHADVLPILGQRAVQFLEDHHRNAAKQPFFLYLPLTAPHTPWLPTESFRGTTTVGEYGDFVSQVDGVLMQILEALDRLQLADDTLVIFSSDNGPVWFPQDARRWGHQSAGPLRGMKADLWEGGHRVPLLVRWPAKVEAGQTSDALVCLTDCFATLAETLRVSVPTQAAEDSVSFFSELTGDETARRTGRKRLVIEGRMVRDAEWKLIVGKPSGGLARYADPLLPESSDVTLVNLQQDPSERTNLAADFPEKVAELQAILDQERAAPSQQ